MPQAALQMYMERLPARKAEMTLMMARAAMIPQLSKRDRRKALAELEKETRTGAPAKPASPGRLQMMGIGVRFVSE